MLCGAAVCACAACAAPPYRACKPLRARGPIRHVCNAGLAGLLTVRDFWLLKCLVHMRNGGERQYGAATCSLLCNGWTFLLMLHNV